MDRNIETILSYANIVDEISAFVKLKKTGQNYSGLCPFHSEKTPSFSVNESKGLYYCFGCGKGGNVINFLKDIKGESFGEVADYLKKKYNIPVEDTKFHRAEKSAENKDPFKKILGLALNFYYENLFVYASGSRHIIKYLNDRGISENTARDFKLGYAGFGNGLAALLSNNKADLDIAVNIGLLVKKPEHNGRYGDRFINKLIIPIMDRSGEPVAFGSRMLPGGTANQPNNYPKYINTNNSEVFIKNSTLFGLDKSLPYIKKENSVYVVEGYFDMITLYSGGVRNVAATMGTALSKNHIVSLSRICDEIVLLYDGDKAGINAINRGIELFEGFMDNPDKNIYAVCLNDGSDPDSYVRKYGAGRLIKFISDNKKTPVDFTLDYYMGKISQTPVENAGNGGIINNRDGFRELKEKTSMIRGIIPFLRKINNGIIVSHYINLLANRLGLKEDAVRDYIYSGGAGTAGFNDGGGSTGAVGPAVPEAKESLGTEDRIIWEIFCNLLLTEYISDDIIYEFSDKNAVFIIKEIKSTLKNGYNYVNDGRSVETSASSAIIVEDIIAKTENSLKWRNIYYSSLMSENAASGEPANHRSSFKKLLVKLKVDNINKACFGLLGEIKSGLLDESGRALKLKELDRLKSISNEFRKKLAIL